MSQITLSRVFKPWLRTAAIWLLMPVCLVAGPTKEYSRSINREFGTLADGTTVLYNKHGQVEVKTWGNNSVRIDIAIIVNAYSDRDAENMFNRINVNFANAPGYVKAETFVDGAGAWWDPPQNLDFRVEYTVYMPLNNQLELRNRYANSAIANLNGKLIADIKYGDLKAATLGNDADLNLGNGKAWISKVRNLYGAIAFGTLTINEAQDVQIDSKNSILNISAANSARLTSRYDNLTLGNVKELRLQTKYSDVKISGVGASFITAQYSDVNVAFLTRLLDADMQYGNLNVGNLQRGFDEVKMAGKHTDFTIVSDRSISYRFDLQGDGVCEMTLPREAIFRQKHESANSKMMGGYVGDANTRSAISARLAYGALNIR